MSVGVLQQKLDSYMWLKTQKAHLLPDGGKKLDNAINLIHSILNDKRSLPPPEPQPVPTAKTIFNKSPARVNALRAVEEEDETEDEDLEDITTALRSIDIKESVVDTDNEELFKFPDDPLSSHEIDQFLVICKIPSNCYSDQILCHPFVFHLGLIGPNCVCLRVIDCQKRENIFARYGTPSIWNVKFKLLKSGETKEGYNYQISHPGSAMNDLWFFVHKAVRNVKDWPVFVFDSKESLNNFKVLFCTSSVQHYPGSKDIPRSSRFVVHEKAESLINEESVQAADHRPGDITALDDHHHLVALAESYSKERMTALSLEKMKPKTVAWLEAPLNYRSFLHISKTATGAVASVPPYLPASASYQVLSNPNSHEPQAASAPILSSFEDSLLRCLAIAGFAPQSLAILAAKGGWRGFAGVLFALGISKESPETLADLYRCFTKVNRGLAINTDLYKEDAKKASIKDLWNESPRTLKFLLNPPPIHSESPDERIRITMPPATDKLLRYREDRLYDSDDSSGLEEEEEQN
ncbi:hypothetical protein Aperf_G00000050024 [Anoplocephala perfoliata]